MRLEPLPPSFAETRAALHALACYVVAPARKEVDDRIGLRATGDGFGTPAFGDRARRVVVRGNNLVVEEGGSVTARSPITNLRAAAEAVGVELSADPGVGRDIPEFAPDASLAVDVDASLALGGWYSFVEMALVDVREKVAARGVPSELTLWPEHFDLAFDWGPDAERRVNLGGSPGDSSSSEPYLYVGPWDPNIVACDRYWNEPYGAAVPYGEVLAADDPRAFAIRFLIDGIDRLGY